MGGNYAVVIYAVGIIAGIIAEGNSKIYGLQHLDRGYENFESKLKMLGIEIMREINSKTIKEKEYLINSESKNMPKFKAA